MTDYWAWGLPATDFATPTEVAMVADGLAEQAEVFEKAVQDSDDPVGNIAGAYRSFGLAHPHLYRLMTDRPLSRAELPAGTEEGAAAPLVDAVGGDIDRARATWAVASDYLALISVLFIVAAVTSALGVYLQGSILEDPGYFTSAAADETRVSFAVLLDLIAAASIAAIAVVIFAVLRLHSERSAFGCLAARIIEATIIVVGAVSGLLGVAVGVKGVFGQDPFSTVSVLLFLPIAINEMVLAGWLIVRGFNPVTTASQP